MFCLRSSMLSLSAVTLLSACGGGSDSKPADGGEGNTVVSSSNIIKSADKHSVAELKKAANELVTSRYKGKKTVAPMNIETSQRFYQQLFGNASGNIPEFQVNDIANLVDANGNLDATSACISQGTVKYQGKFDKNGVGTAVATFVNCNDGYNGITLSGTLAVSSESQTGNTQKISLYFDNLMSSNQYIEQPISISGYQVITVNDNNGSYSTSSVQKMLFSLGENTQAMFDSTMETGSSNTGGTLNITGKAYLGDIGYVDIQTLNMNGLPSNYSGGQLVFTGDKQVAFEFGDNLVKYVEDTDNDGSFDVGTYFSNVYEIDGVTIASKKLVALTELSLPPSYVGSPRTVHYHELYTADAIVVEPGDYSDPDTPKVDLEISYRWYINGEFVDNQSSNTLPAYTAVFGDEVKVTMVVFDGANAIESTVEYISLADSPIQLTVTGIPEVISAGDSIQFSVDVSDPDVKVMTEQSVLVSGPLGATIDSNGVVNWQVSQDFLFPYQTFEFTFGIAGENGEVINQKTVSIEAKSNKAFPIARSGIEVPTRNKSMWIADFDGDGGNEVLATNNINTVFLLEHNNGIYTQKWVYPFKLPTKGNITQVLAYNLDDDVSKEIIVITEHGISVIDGLANAATVLLTTDDYISTAAIDDVNHDGKHVLAYLHASDSNSNKNKLSVIDINAPENTLFTTGIDDAKQVIFANVDNDTNLELITNNGLIYDGVTWFNEWASGTDFGDLSITAGDYNGDGIAEIAGANARGNLSVYSALTKSQLDSVDNLNTCSVYSANVDQDSVDELLVGECQGGNVSAYDLVDDKLTEQWQVSTQVYGAVSLVTGDSDNDGQVEVHWGSGENTLVAADLTVNTLDGIIVNSAVVKVTPVNPQLNSYSSAGWASIDGTNERAVFFIPTTWSGASRLVTIDKQGDYQLSEEISSNWNGSAFAVTTDFNNDGFGDLFLPSTNVYPGGFAAMQLFDYATHWQKGGDSNSVIGLIKSQDLNNDTFEDAIYVDRSTLNAVDIDNQQIIFKHSFDGDITDFAIDKVNNKLVAVAHQNGLSLFLQNNSSLSELSFIDQTCDRISFFNADTDAELELLCASEQIASTNYEPGLIVYDIVDNALMETAVYSLNKAIIDIAIDTSTVNEQSIFVTAASDTSDDYWNYHDAYHVKKLSAQGKLIWIGPELLGRPTNQGLKVRYSETNGHQMQLSTESMMYLIN